MAICSMLALVQMSIHCILETKLNLTSNPAKWKKVNMQSILHFAKMWFNFEIYF